MNITHLCRMLVLILTPISLALTSCGANPLVPEPTAEVALDNATKTSAVLISVQVAPGDIEKRILNEEQITLDNCNGNVPLSSTVERSHSVFRVAEIGTSAELNVSGSLGVPGVGSVEVGSAIAQHYNVSYGEEETVSRSISVAAKEGSHVEHVVQQFETWETGELVIFVGGIEATREPYSFRKDFGVEVVRILNIDDCVTSTPAVEASQDGPLPTNTPYPTYTLFPTYTPPPQIQADLVATPVNPTEPVATESIDTPQDSVLEVGDWWQTNGVWLRVKEASFSTSTFNITMEMWNKTGGQLIFEWKRDYFTLTDNTGYTYPVWWGYDSSGGTELFEVGELKAIDDAHGDTVVFGDEHLFSLAVTDVFLTVVNVSRISNAKFHIRVPK